MISLLLAVLSAAPAPTVEVRLAPGPVTVGDHVEATLAVATAHGDLTGPPRFPVWRETWGEAEIVRAEPPRETRSADGDALWTQRLVLRAFRPGAIRLPRVAVALPFTEKTIRARTPEGAALTVVSVLPPGADPKKSEPEPAEPMRQLPVGAAFWWTAGILSALCLAAGRWVWRPRRGPLTAPGRPAVLPPFSELASELSQAASAPPLEAHVRLSWALRRYLGRVLQVPAVYSTTSQIQLQLLSRRLPGPLVRRAVELLRACDLVKFARGEAGAGQTAERLLAAREIGREIEERFAPAVAPAVPAEQAA